MISICAPAFHEPSSSIGMVRNRNVITWFGLPPTTISLRNDLSAEWRRAPVEGHPVMVNAVEKANRRHRCGIFLDVNDQNPFLDLNSAVVDFAAVAVIE